MFSDNKTQRYKISFFFWINITYVTSVRSNTIPFLLDLFLDSTEISSLLFVVLRDKFYLRNRVSK